MEKLANGDLSDKRFLKALVEDNDPANGAFAYVYGDSEGRPTHLVAWRAETYTSPLNDYPVAASTPTQITLPTSFSVASGADYFYLSWDAARDGAVGSSGVVTVAGAASNVVEVKLSGVPIVIPLAPNDCRYSSTGELLNCESCPSPQPAGTACDDGDENTEDDVILADGCTCRGKVIEPEPCTPATAEVRYTACGGAVEIGVSDNRVRIVSNTYSETLIARVRNETWSYSVQLCNDFTAGANCIAEATVEIPQAEIDRYDGAFVLDLQNCDNLAITIGGSDSGGGTDNDGDGVCAVDDCNDQDPSVPAPPGTACDDGDPKTTNDLIQSDGCSCAGTVAQTCNLAVPGSCITLLTCIEVVESTVRVTLSADTPPFRVDVHRADYTPVTGVCDSWQGGAPACTGTVASAALGQGDYLLRVQGSDQTDDVACWIPFTITPKSTVSVTGGSPGGTISLYPNPGSQVIYLQMTPTETITGVEIYSSLGKRVRTFVGNVRELDVADLPGGAYFVKIQGQKRTVSRTLLLE